MKTKYDGVMKEFFYDEKHGTQEATYDSKAGRALRQLKISSILIRVLENKKNNYVEEEVLKNPSYLVLQQTVEMESRKNCTSGSRFMYFHPKHDFEVICTDYKWMSDAEVLKSYENAK